MGGPKGDPIDGAFLIFGTDKSGERRAFNCCDFIKLTTNLGAATLQAQIFRKLAAAVGLACFLRITAKVQGCTYQRLKLFLELMTNDGTAVSIVAR